MREFSCGPVVPLQGTKVPHARWHGQKKKNLYLPHIPVLWGRNLPLLAICKLSFVIPVLDKEQLRNKIPKDPEGGNH